MGRGGIAAAWWSSSGRKVPAVELRGRASELLTDASMETSERVTYSRYDSRRGSAKAKGWGESVPALGIHEACCRLTKDVDARAYSEDDGNDRRDDPGRHCWTRFGDENEREETTEREKSLIPV